MFTGIVTDIGKVRDIKKSGDTRFKIQTSYDMGNIDIGSSIACSGVCLTVVEKGVDYFAVDASNETLSCTTLGNWKDGTAINLEQSLKLGDELGGHIVTGHIDGIAELLSITPEGDSIILEFKAPDELAKYIAKKGSVALDGVSLTVNEVEGSKFWVNIIPHTQEVTTFGKLQAGDKLNIEIDILARYIERNAGYSLR